jgi:hypothetical protein
MQCTRAQSRIGRRGAFPDGGVEWVLQVFKVNVWVTNVKRCAVALYFSPASLNKKNHTCWGRHM